MISIEVIKDYEEAIIKFMKSKEFDFIETDKDEDRNFYDFLPRNWIIPITVLLEFVLDDNRNIDQLDLIFSCFTTDDTMYYFNDKTDFESKRISVIDRGRIITSVANLSLEPIFSYTYSMMLDRNIEIAKEIALKVPSQQYISTYYSNFMDNYKIIDGFLRASNITEDELMDFYIRIERNDMFPEAIKDIFLF